MVVVAAYSLVLKPKMVSVTVRLHDAQVIDLSQKEEEIASVVSKFGVTDFHISGTVTINSLSATDVTIKLLNKDTGEWITIIEGQTVTDLTTANDFTKDIPIGTYEKLSVHFGTLDLDMTHTEIGMSGTYQGIPFNWTVPAGSCNYSGSIPVNQTFEVSFTVTVTESRVVDVDTGEPFFLSYDGTNWTLTTKSSYTLQATWL